MSGIPYDERTLAEIRLLNDLWCPAGFKWWIGGGGRYVLSGETGRFFGCIEHYGTFGYTGENPQPHRGRFEAYDERDNRIRGTYYSDHTGQGRWTCLDAAAKDVLFTIGFTPETDWGWAP